MKEQRIYWIKHPVDYYERPEIIMIQAKGAEGYVILALFDKLVLQAAKNDNRVRFNEYEPMKPEYMSAIYRIPLEYIESGLKELSRFHMIETLADGTIMIPDIEDYIGSETPDAARKREERAEKKENSDNVRTLSGQRPIDKEKEKDIDISKKEILKKENSEKSNQPPTLEEVTDFVSRNKFKVDPKEFIAYYAAMGWKRGATNVARFWKENVELWHIRNMKLKTPAGGVQVKEPGLGKMVDKDNIPYMQNTYDQEHYKRKEAQSLEELDALLEAT
ncbi:MAG: phage replisome organizer N-terminal domain-containing protein [Bacteroidales bacterium]|nr:phage replisome organizer N-terminal domain-containing protein [Bacteroidales bacterium]